MWIKLILGGCIIAFCMAMGRLAAEKYRTRAQFYAQFYDFNERFLSELTYSRKPLDAFIAGIDYRGEFKEFLASRGREAKKLAFLPPGERQDAADYLSMLGQGDSAAQRGYFSSKREILASRKQASAEEAKKRFGLYLKLGLLAGLAFVILIA